VHVVDEAPVVLMVRPLYRGPPILAVSLTPVIGL
jgi:hypothetical protein